MNDSDLPEIKLDTDNLYREETFSDRKAGVLRRLTPVKRDGTPDSSREPLFLGQTQLMTQMGMLPISFEIEAKSLEEALDKFPAAAKEGIKQTIEELQELRREQASSLIIPGAGGAGMPGGGMAGGGIQVP